MDYHGIQAEKAEAVTRYRRLRKVAKMWRSFQVLVVLALLSWSSTRLPVVVKLTGQCVTQLSDYLFNPHINFIIGNAIIVLLVLLSRQNNSRSNAGSGDVYEEYVRNSEAGQKIGYVSDGVTPNSPPPLAPEIDFGGKQIAVSENAVTQTQCDAVSTDIEKATKQIQRFERTQSEKLKRDLRGEPNRKFRRSETHVRPRPIASERATSSFETVDGLSDEEFRRTIDEFIARGPCGNRRWRRATSKNRSYVE